MRYVIILLFWLSSSILVQSSVIDSPITYAMRSKIVPFLGLGNSLRCFNLTTDKIQASDWIAHDIVAINVLSAHQVLLTVRNTFTSDYSVLRYDGVTHSTFDWLHCSNLEPKRWVLLNSKLYMVAAVPSEALHPDDPAPVTRLYVYRNDPAEKMPTVSINVREGRYAVLNGVIQDVTVDSDRNRLYLLVTGSEASNNHMLPEGASFILVLDAETDQIIDKLALPFLQFARGICAVKSDLFLTAQLYLNVTNQWVPNMSIWVIDPAGKRVKTIPDAIGGQQLIWSPEDNRLFVRHENQGKKPPFISVINVDRDRLDDRFPIPGLESVEYVGNHRLFTATTKKLVIWNTRTLKVNREFRGRYLLLGKH